MKILKHLFFGTVFVFLLNGIALGCLCHSPDSPKEALKQSNTVFSGEVIDIDKIDIDTYNVAILTFRVENVWKSVSTKEIVVRDYMSESSCAAADFKIGERYIVFASSRNEEGEILKDEQNKPFISVDVCSWTTNLANPAVKKKILNKIGKGKLIN